jgi:hypothetical protein
MVLILVNEQAKKVSRLACSVVSHLPIGLQGSDIFDHRITAIAPAPPDRGERPSEAAS